MRTILGLVQHKNGLVTKLNIMGETKAQWFHWIRHAPRIGEHINFKKVTLRVAGWLRFCRKEAEVSDLRDPQVANWEEAAPDRN